MSPDGLLEQRRAAGSASSQPAAPRVSSFRCENDRAVKTYTQGG
jgi:hypothetical protein